MQEQVAETCDAKRQRLEDEAFLALASKRKCEEEDETFLVALVLGAKDKAEERALDEASLEAASCLEETQHAQNLLRAMASANDLPGQWRAAVAYVRQNST